jgi:hypothetical protein
MGFDLRYDQRRPRQQQEVRCAKGHTWTVDLAMTNGATFITGDGENCPECGAEIED